MDEKFKDHLEDLKKHEPDLYEEFEDEDLKEQLKTTGPHTKKRRKYPPFIKGSIILIAIIMFVGALGSIAAVFNLPAIEFLKKSRELSQFDYIQQYKEAVVTVKSDDRKGTGFNVEENGLIITNYHITEGNSDAMISFPNGKVFHGTVIRSIPSMDISFISVDTKDALPFLVVEQDTKWQKGEHVYFIGNPLSFNQIANEGEIIGKSLSSGLDIPVMMIDAPIYKGNSGSPVINEEGVVIAVIYATSYRKIENSDRRLGLAIPVEHFFDYLPSRY